MNPWFNGSGYAGVFFSAMSQLRLGGVRKLEIKKGLSITNMNTV